MKSQLKDDVKKAKNAARRLVVTERQRAAGHVQMKIYQDSGIRFYRFISEQKCCKICAGLEGKIFKVSQGQAGINLRPMHPYCRCSTAMAADPQDADFNEWLSLHDSGIDPKSIPAWSEFQKSSHTAKTYGGNYGGWNDLTDPDNSKRDQIAEDLYTHIRNRKPEFEIQAVAKNSGFKYEDVERIYEHIFIRKHLLYGGRIDRFDPSYYMAHSWMRLREGTNIQSHDLTLLHHELIEEAIMKDRIDVRYYDAHQVAAQQYNYDKELNEYLKTQDA